MTERRLRTLALFASLCLFLSVVELMIPKPIPFLRLGLANLPILLALTIFPTAEVFIVIFLKVVGQAVVSGTLLSYVFLFSAAGSFAGGVVMLLLRGLYGRWISLVGIGVAGALANNLVQLAISALLIFGKSTRLIAAPFILAGTLTGLIIGIAAEVVRRRSKWIAAVAEVSETVENEGTRVEGTRLEGTPGYSDFLPVFRLIVGIALIPPFLLHTDMGVRGLQLLICVLVAVSADRKFRPLPGLIVFTAVITAHILMPMGQVVVRIFDFPVTYGALREGANKGLAVVGLVFLSRFAVSKELRIPGAPGRMVYLVLYFFEELTAFRPDKGLSRKPPPKSGGKWRNRMAELAARLRGLMSRLDAFLLEKNMETGEVEYETESAGGSESGRGVPSRRKKSRLAGILVPLFLLLLQWGLYLLAANDSLTDSLF